MPNLVGIGLSQVPTNSMLGGMAYQDPDRVKIKKLHIDEISQINSEIDDNATDIFIYDTSKDSDGGAWRKRTSHTSWYNETLGTATRGTRREFPAVAVIVSTTTEVTIYDGDDPNLPMWMVFNASSNNGINNVQLLQYGGQGSGYPTAALNGVLVLGQRTSGDNWGNPIVNFISEYIVRADPQSTEGGVFNGGVAQRNDTVGFHSPGKLIINNSRIYDVAMTVRQGAPVDPDTGLPTPTIALAHKSGIAVITDLINHVVKDINTDGTVGPAVDFIDFYNGDSIVCGWDTVGGGTRNTYTYKIPTNATNSASTASIVKGRYVDPTTGGGSLIYYSEDAARITKVLGLKNNRFILVPSTYNPALTLIDENDADTNAPNGMSAFIHADFNTGWMQGRCKLATLSSTSTTNLTNGQTASDRSPNNLHLTVTGTITKTAVATGAELVAYSGFLAGGSGSYLTRAYNGNFDFGTGDFHVIFWMKDIRRYETIYSYGNNSSTSGNLIIQTGPSNDGDDDRIYINGSAIQSNISGYKNTAWGMKAIVRRSGTVYFYMNGVQYHSAGNGGSIGNSNNTLRIGEAGNASGAQSIGEDALDQGSIALLRAGLSAPSEAQLKKMYHDEKFLFQENAKATVYGSSTVNALAYDEVTDRYHVATSSGRSDFQGLRRINNTTTAVTTAISAHDGLIVEQ